MASVATKVHLIPARTFRSLEKTARDNGMPSFTRRDLSLWTKGRADRIQNGGPFTFMVSGTDGATKYIAEAVVPQLKRIAPEGTQFVEGPMAGAAFRASPLASTPEYWRTASTESVWAAALPENTWQLALRSDGTLFGAVGDPQFDGNDKIPPKLRPQYALIRFRSGYFANVRIGRFYPEILGLSPLHPRLLTDKNGNPIPDITVVRELAGDVYVGEPKGFVAAMRRREQTFTFRLASSATDTAIDTMLYTQADVDRIMRYAFSLAAQKGQPLTLFDKSNILAVGALWRRALATIKSEFPGVRVTPPMYTDNGIAQMVTNPRQFGVVVGGNLDGDYTGDVLGALVGTLGIIPSISHGQGLFGPYAEPVHGSALALIPKSGRVEDCFANPIGYWLSGALLFRHVGLRSEADAMDQAVKTVLAGGLRTPDLIIKDADGNPTLGQGEAGVGTLAMATALGEATLGILGRS